MQKRSKHVGSSLPIKPHEHWRYIKKLESFQISPSTEAPVYQRN